MLAGVLAIQRLFYQSFHIILGFAVGFNKFVVFLVFLKQRDTESKLIADLLIEFLIGRTINWTKLFLLQCQWPVAVIGLPILTVYLPAPAINENSTAQMITLADDLDMLNGNIENDDRLDIGARCSMCLEEHEMPYGKLMHESLIRAVVGIFGLSTVQ